MLSGRQTLSNIDQAVSEARARIASAESQIEQARQQSLAARQAQAQDYRALAQIRLSQIGSAELVRQLDQAERQAMALLERRKSDLAELEAELGAADAAAKALESERADQAVRVDAAARAVDAADAATQARLAADSSYLAQQARAQEAGRLARSAHEKAVSAVEERERKGAAYRADPLFVYLWDRGYGTPAYRVWGLTRMLDGWVAGLVGFADARANFARLNEIPERLREHAAGLAAVAETELGALRALDEAARAADGIPGLEARRGEEQARLDAIDARIAESRQARQALDARKAMFANGEDEQGRQAVEYLATELAREDLMALRREALATPFPEDDLIVARMLERDDEERRQLATLQGLQDALTQQQRRLAELEGVRSDFLRRGYDRPGSSFGDAALIATVLGQFLNGLLDRENLWRVLGEQQRYRPERSDPSFGSGGFGRGSPWGGGMGDLGDLLGGPGRGRRHGGGGLGPRGGGGFRTGGGF